MESVCLMGGSSQPLDGAVMCTYVWGRTQWMLWKVKMLWIKPWEFWVPYLVGGLEHLDYFPYIGKFIIPTDELIFFRGVAQPPTSYVQTKPNQSVEVIYFLSVDGNCKPIPQASTLQIGDQIQQPGYLSFICHQIISHLLETCHEFSPRNYTLCCGFGASVFGQSRRLVVISRNYSGRMFLLNQAIECDIIEYYRCLSPKSPFWMLY